MPVVRLRIVEESIVVSVVVVASSIGTELRAADRLMTAPVCDVPTPRGWLLTAPPYSTDIKSGSLSDGDAAAFDAKASAQLSIQTGNFWSSFSKREVL
jgi:hypothetical protein